MPLREEKHAKQVIVMRRDLGMSPGKMVAQGAHAAVSWLTEVVQTNAPYPVDFSEAEIEWLEGHFTKITVWVDSEDELLNIYDAAGRAGIESHLIVDDGTTEFNGQLTKTCCAIGPDWNDVIDKITRHLSTKYEKELLT